MSICAHTHEQGVRLRDSNSVGSVERTLYGAGGFPVLEIVRLLRRPEMTSRYSAFVSAVALATAAGACGHVPAASETGKVGQAVTLPVSGGCGISLDSVTLDADSVELGLTITARPSGTPTYGTCGLDNIYFGWDSGGATCDTDSLNLTNTTLPPLGTTTITRSGHAFDYVVFDNNAYWVLFNGEPDCDPPFTDTADAILCDGTLVENPSTYDCSALGTGGSSGTAGSSGTGGLPTGGTSGTGGSAGGTSGAAGAAATGGSPEGGSAGQAGSLVMAGIGGLSGGTGGQSSGGVSGSGEAGAAGTVPGGAGGEPPSGGTGGTALPTGGAAPDTGGHGGAHDVVGAAGAAGVGPSQAGGAAGSAGSTGAIASGGGNLATTGGSGATVTATGGATAASTGGASTGGTSNVPIGSTGGSTGVLTTGGVSAVATGGVMAVTTTGGTTGVMAATGGTGTEFRSGSDDSGCGCSVPGGAPSPWRAVAMACLIGALVIGRRRGH